MRWRRVLISLCFVLLLRPADAAANGFEGLRSLWSSLEVFERLATSGGAECRSHSSTLLKALKNATFWAVQMVDSSANVPSGILEGSVYNLGDFDECLSVDTGLVQGQYCLAALQVHGPGLPDAVGRPVSDALHQPYSFSNAWFHVQDRGERWRVPRDTLKLAFCVPKACSNVDVSRAVLEAFAPKFRAVNATLKVDIPERLCSIKKEFEISSLDIAFFSVVGILFTLTVTATVLDFCLGRAKSSKDASLGQKVLLCYSARKHFLGLANVEKESDTDLNFLFGIRLVSILAVILSHKAGFTTAGPLKNPNFQEQSFSQLQYMPVLHGDLVVDTFFFLAGFLLTVGMLKVLRKPIPGISVSVWPLYLFRYLRLTPAYMLTVLFYVSLLPKMGSGPLWQVTVVPESEHCLQNWWANLLYVNNYVRVERSCIEQGWYMPCDMHLFVVCAPLVLLLHRKPRLGRALLALLLFASLMAPFLTIWVMNTDAMLLFFLDFLRGSRIHPYFSALYVKSHVRASPYFIGVVIGLIYMNRRHVRLAKAKALPLLVIALVIGTATSLSGALFYHTEGATPTSLLTRAVYGALHRAVWALAIGMFVLAISLGRLVLGWRPLVPFSKLSYGAYLIHIVILWYTAGSVRESAYNNSFIVILKTMGDTVVTFGAALLLYLAVEAPIRDMAKLALSARMKSQTSEKEGGVDAEMHSSEIASNCMSHSVSSTDSGVCALHSLDQNFNRESAVYAL